MLSQIHRSVGVLWHLSSVVIAGYFSAIYNAGARQAFGIVSHRQHRLVCGNSLVHHIQGYGVAHFAQHQPCTVGGVGGVQNLTRAKTSGRGLVGFYIRNAAALPAPGVVNQQLGIYAEQLV